MGGHITAAWGAAIEAWLVHARCAGSPSTTLTTRRQHLEHLARRIGVDDPWCVTGAQLLAYFGGQDWARETRRGHRCTLRVFYDWAREHGHLPANPALALPKVQPAVPRPRPAPDKAYKLALATAEPRERLMLRLSAELGLRRAEVAQVHKRDLVRDMTGWSVLVHGKGGRERVLPMPASLASAVWAVINANGGGFLFPGRDHGHLSPRWVGKVVGRLLPEGYTMHTLRHRFATRAYDVERDVFVVQELLGHASPVTTRRYVLVDHHRLRSTVEAVTPDARPELRSVPAT